MMIRPEMVDLVPDEEAAAFVVDREFFGHDQMVTVALPGGGTIRARLGPAPWVRPQARVRVAIGAVTTFRTGRTEWHGRCWVRSRRRPVAPDGRGKLLLEIEGVPAVLRIAAALSVVADDIVVAGRAGIWFGLSGIPDPGQPHRGPLAGIVVALSAGTGWIAVAGVDQPWLCPGTVLELGRLADWNGPWSRSTVDRR